MQKLREDVIRRLAHEGIKAMDGNGIEDLSPNEVLSAGFSLVKTMILVYLEMGKEAEVVIDKSSIISAIADLYATVAPEKVN